MQPLACCLTDLAADRAHHRALTQEFLAAIQVKHESENGYRLGIAAAGMSLVRVAEWITLESRCCPFLDFRLESLQDRATIWVEITGPAGAKEALDAELWAMAGQPSSATP